MDENTSMNNFDYTEERDNMDSAIRNFSKKQIAVTAATIVGAIGATGLVVKGRKKIAKVVRKAEIKYLKKRKNTLNNELVDIETKLKRYSNDSSED